MGVYEARFLRICQFCKKRYRETFGLIAKNTDNEMSTISYHHLYVSRPMFLLLALPPPPSTCSPPHPPPSSYSFNLEGISKTIPLYRNYLWLLQFQGNEYFLAFMKYYVANRRSFLYGKTLGFTVTKLTMQGKQYYPPIFLAC